MTFCLCSLRRVDAEWTFTGYCLESDGITITSPNYNRRFGRLKNGKFDAKNAKNARNAKVFLAFFSQFFAPLRLCVKAFESTEIGERQVYDQESEG